LENWLVTKYENTDDILSVSFILPTFNAGEKLKQCLKNISKQKYPKNKMEVINIDGGSSDNTLKIAKEYNCKVIHNPKERADPEIFLGIMASRARAQIIQEKRNKLVLKIVKGKEFDRNIITHMKENLLNGFATIGEDVAVEIQIVKEIPSESSGKRKIIISLPELSSTNVRERF